MVFHTFSDQAVKSGHTVVVLETNLCNVLGFLDQLKSNNGVPSPQKPPNNGLIVWVSGGPSILPNHPQAWSTVEC